MIFFWIKSHLNTHHTHTHTRFSAVVVVVQFNQCEKKKNVCPWNRVSEKVNGLLVCVCVWIRENKKNFFSPMRLRHCLLFFSDSRIDTFIKFHFHYFTLLSLSVITLEFFFFATWSMWFSLLWYMCDWLIDSLDTHTHTG